LTCCYHLRQKPEVLAALSEEIPIGWYRTRSWLRLKAGKAKDIFRFQYRLEEESTDNMSEAMPGGWMEELDQPGL